MSKLLNDGGPAFPFSFDRDKANTTYLGMSLRDWFAGQALSGIAATDGFLTYAKDAEMAYRYADAMLKAREET